MYVHAISDARCVFDMGVSSVNSCCGASRSVHFCDSVLYDLDTCDCSRNTHLCFGYTFTSVCLPQEEIGFNMKILDIGGGFAGTETQLELVSILSDFNMILLQRTHGLVDHV